MSASSAHDPDPWARTRAERAPGPEPDPDTSEVVWFLRLMRGLVVFVYGVVVAVLIMLVLGFAMRLLGASTDAAFTRWVYRNDERVMEPFRGMFPTEAVGDHSVVDFSLLFGMIVYALVALVLHAAISWLARQIVRRVETGRSRW